ncbi:MAG: hypothetical protein RI922_423 [Bacteroidota bacterium]|jgi:uncharacterized protein YbcC (UPF0753/DUF2309 family)
MKKSNSGFNLHESLEELKHFLPAQAPLKDFVHHNTLHAFQKDSFFDALNKAHEIFGYKVFLTIDEYRQLYKQGKISDAVLDRVLISKTAEESLTWRDRLINKTYIDQPVARIGSLRSNWKSFYKIDLDSLVHPILFRIIGSYLDQGISIWNFPSNANGFLDSIKELERNSLVSFFKTERVKSFLIEGKYSVESLLKIVVGDPNLYEQYIFDQQFAHPGWSGIIAVIEENPTSLIDQKKVSLEDLIIFELLLEIDALDEHFGTIWSPLGLKLENLPEPLFSDVNVKESTEVKRLWQQAYEWSYYDTVLLGLQKHSLKKEADEKPSFQGFFCIDDRECSIRRHIELEDKDCRTFGTAGFFNVEFYFQPEHSDFRTKVCPAPVTPKYLIKEIENTNRAKSDFHFGKHTHGLLSGWLLTHTLGFWSALRLFFTVFKPSQNAASVTSFSHMDKHSILTIENVNGEMTEDGLQVGFTVEEMANRLEGLLRSTGLLSNFADLIYVVGHGSSSVNNTHYAGYDCGACSGRPGSVNARVISHIGNHSEVRKIMAERGIHIPAETQFIGALHDTSRDEMMYYDLKVLSDVNFAKHNEIKLKFDRALSANAKERSRRFMSINTKKSSVKVHEKVKLRTVSLFEPRPELNHATNTLAVVGRRDFTKNLFLDRRSFMNSYDYKTDPEGNYLLTILNAVAPVCGGINLEYYFSRVDNQNLGAGTKLPHNVMGLIGVANGIDGDLRTGLPSQMIEVHDPLRLMVIVEHFPTVVLDTIKRNPGTYEWFKNEWVKLAVVNPETKEIFVYTNDEFEVYNPVNKEVKMTSNLLAEIESTHENLPVYLIQD